MDLAELTAVRDEAADAGETRVVLRGVSWSQYEALLGALGDDHPGVRLAYLEGAVEIKSPSRLHEALKLPISPSRWCCPAGASTGCRCMPASA